MRYGELWKAKVLAAIPQVIIDEMAQYNRDSLRHDQEFARQCMENNIETINYRDQEEWETNHALNLRKGKCVLTCRSVNSMPTCNIVSLPVNGSGD